MAANASISSDIPVQTPEITPNLARAISYLQRGKIIGITERTIENETDLCKAACFMEAEDVRTFKEWGSGLMYVPLNPLRVQELGLRDVIPMSESKDANGTAFQTPINLKPKHGLTTGMSYHDRALTIKALASPSLYGKEDFALPGHTCVLRGRPGGLAERQGHTESSLALMKLAGLYPAAVLSEIIDQVSGEALTGEQVKAFALEHDIPLVTVEEIKTMALFAPSPKVNLPLRLQGELVSGVKVQSHRVNSSVEYVVLTKGKLHNHSKVFLRIHSECLTGDLLQSDKCDCGAQWRATLERLASLEQGIAVYVRGHEGRGIGLCQKLQAYALQDDGLNTKEANEMLNLPADCRSYPMLKEIIRGLGVSSVCLFTSNAKKVEALGELVAQVTPFEGPVTENNSSYLAVKAKELNGVIASSLFSPISPPQGSIPSSSSPPSLLKPGKRIGIAHASGWRREWLKKMLDSCVQHISKDSPCHVIVPYEVRGSFELPLAARRLIRDHGCDSVIALGILVDGETYHFRTVADVVTQGLMKVGLKEGVPVVDGILYCLNESQVAERVEGDKACTPGWVAIALDKEKFQGYHHYEAQECKV